jgi:hypothetical protein
MPSCYVDGWVVIGKMQRVRVAVCSTTCRVDLAFGRCVLRSMTVQEGVAMIIRLLGLLCTIFTAAVLILQEPTTW